MAQAEFEGYPAEVHSVMGDYKEVMFRRIGALETAYRVPFQYLFEAYHALALPDRLLNCKKFPIGIAFGDRDFMGSEGADQIVETSAFYGTGESQLFKIPNAGHLPHIQAPQALVRILIGFFGGSLRGSFERKPRDAFESPKPPRSML